jgi:hypothetical protein
MHHRHFMSLFAVALSGMVLLVTILHLIEAAVWATAYVLLAALPDPRAGMLYSLSALTTYGHASALLPDHWKMLGALEALRRASDDLIQALPSKRRERSGLKVR